MGATGRRVHGNNQMITVRTGPGRYLVAPPYLSGNAPVTDVVQPVKIIFGPYFRNNAGLAVLNRSNGFFGQGFGLYEPLL